MFGNVFLQDRTALTLTTQHPVETLRQSGFDSLRALAVTGVLYSHFVSERFGLGSLGVHIFFVLSGLLITRILLSLRKKVLGHEIRLGSALKSFYARRALRLLPAYYVCITATAVAVPLMREYFWWHVAFLSNILFATSGAYLPVSAAHLWSLGVEEQFYLLWPFIVLFLRPKYFHCACLVLIVLSISSKIVLSLTNTPLFVIWFSPTSHLDYLAGGALLAIRRAPRVLSTTRCVAGLVFVAIAKELFLNSYAAGVALDALGLICIIGLVERANVGFEGRVGLLLQSAPILYIGRISYGIYLYHLIVRGSVLLISRNLNVPLEGQGWALFAFASLLSVMCASVSWRILEKPINDRKQHFPF